MGILTFNNKIVINNGYALSISDEIVSSNNKEKNIENKQIEKSDNISDKENLSLRGKN